MYKVLIEREETEYEQLKKKRKQNQIIFFYVSMSFTYLYKYPLYLSLPILLIYKSSKKYSFVLVKGYISRHQDVWVFFMIYIINEYVDPY